MDDQKLTDSFHLAWDNFPETVTLVYKDRTVIAINKVGEQAGRKKVGIKCSTMPPLESHKMCKANDCIKNHTATYAKWKGDLEDVVTFWLPIDGYYDYFIHFSVGAAIKYEYAI
jgi:hypothetical protein